MSAREGTLFLWGFGANGVRSNGDGCDNNIYTYTYFSSWMVQGLFFGGGRERERERRIDSLTVLFLLDADSK